MPRRLRIHLPGGCYHVTLRGNHQQPIFQDDADRRLLHRIVARAIERFSVRVHAYCWMTNHIHLLVQVGQDPLAHPMRQIAAEFARAMQARVPTTGHFFERRYHAVLVEVETYLKALVRYIHLNPVEAGMVRDPAQYPWSSHCAYLGRQTEPWLTTNFVLGHFGTNRARASAEYRRFMADYADGNFSGWLSAESTQSGVLGSDDFIATVSRRATSPHSQQTLDALLAEACRRFVVNETQLSAPGRDQYLTRVRAWIAHQARKRGIGTLAAVARALGRHEATLRQGMRSHPGEIE